VRELNFAVQRTIDRIIFLRICEDRGVETDRQLQLQFTLNGPNIDFELYNSSNVRVLQWYSTGQSFTANTPSSYSTTWHVPTNQATGAYRFTICVFGPGWVQSYVWNNAAATITVA